jgi:FMN reductase
VSLLGLVRKNRFMSNVVTIVSSPDSRSRLETLHDTARRLLTAAGHRVDAIPLRELPESALLTGNADHPAVRRTRRLLVNAQGIVVINPAYECSCSPLLRAWLDLLPARGLGGQVVQAVSVGAFRSHASGADYTLRRMFAEHGAVRFAPACFLLDKWITADGLDPVAGDALADDLDGFHTEMAKAAALSMAS